MCNIISVYLVREIKREKKVMKTKEHSRHDWDNAVENFKAGLGSKKIILNIFILDCSINHLKIKIHISDEWQLCTTTNLPRHE